MLQSVISRFSIFCRKIIVSQCRKFSQGNPLLFHYFRVSKNFMLQKVMSGFSVEKFQSHSAEKFCREIFYCCIILGYRKSLDKKEGGVSRFSVGNFLSHSAEKIRRRTNYCCSICGYRKSLDKKRGVSEFSVESFLSHTAEKFRRGINYCCSIFGYRKSLDKERGLSNFPSNFFCFTVPKIFLGEAFSVSLISGIEKFCASEGYVTIFDFLSKDYCLRVPKKFAGESFSVALISVTEKVWIRGGEYQDIPWKIFRFTVRKNFAGESFSVSLISGIEKFYASEGYVRLFRQKISVSQCRKFL